MRARGVNVKTFHDNTSHDQNTNLNTIVNYHNAQARNLDVSVHFNAYEEVFKANGHQVLYVTQSALASQMSAAIASCGFINRGGKKRTDLFFLNNTEMPAILIEVCFVDSEADADIYNEHFLDVCDAIADILGGEGDIAGGRRHRSRRRRCSRPPARVQFRRTDHGRVAQRGARLHS